jgi:hypothetical protein
MGRRRSNCPSKMRSTCIWCSNPEMPYPPATAKTAEIAARAPEPRPVRTRAPAPRGLVFVAAGLRLSPWNAPPRHLDPSPPLPLRTISARPRSSCLPACLQLTSRGAPPLVSYLAQSKPGSTSLARFAGLSPLPPPAASSRPLCYSAPPAPPFFN